MRLCLVLLGILTLSGCAFQKGSPAKYYTEESILRIGGHYDKEPAKKITICKKYDNNNECTEEEEVDIRDWNFLYYDAVDSRDDFDKVAKYLKQGLSVNIATCYDFLSALEERQTILEHGRDQALLLGILATGILAITGGGEDAVEGVALGTAFLSDSVNIYRDAFLLGPAPGSVRDLVIKKMRSFKTEVKKRLDAIEDSSASPTLPFNDAFDVLREHAEICTNSGVSSAITEVASKTEFEPPDSGVADTQLAEMMQERARERVTIALEGLLQAHDLDAAIPLSSDEVTALCGYAFQGENIHDGIDHSNLSDSFKGLFQDNTDTLKSKVSDIRKICEGLGDRNQILKDAFEMLAVRISETLLEANVKNEEKNRTEQKTKTKDRLFNEAASIRRKIDKREENLRISEIKLVPVMRNQ